MTLPDSKELRDAFQGLGEGATPRWDCPLPDAIWDAANGAPCTGRNTDHRGAHRRLSLLRSRVEDGGGHRPRGLRRGSARSRAGSSGATRCHAAVERSRLRLRAESLHREEGVDAGGNGSSDG